jgi:hypothetical protein
MRPVARHDMRVAKVAHLSQLSALVEVTVIRGDVTLRPDVTGWEAVPAVDQLAFSMKHTPPAKPVTTVCHRT